jgi:hypothetical protein
MSTASYRLPDNAGPGGYVDTITAMITFDPAKAWLEH